MPECSRKSYQKRLQNNSAAAMLPPKPETAAVFYESMIISKKAKSFSKKCLTILLHLI